MDSFPSNAIVDAFSAYRITRLITADTITRHARVTIIRNAYLRRDKSLGSWVSSSDAEWDERRYNDDDDPPMLAKFVICRWCVGMWAGVFVMVARSVAPRWWDRCARALTFASAAALLARLESEDQ